MDNAYQHSTIAQILENILEQFTFEGESRSNIADILLSILNKTEYNEEPHSVIGDLLIRLKAKIEGESYDPYDAAYTSRIAEILISILEETEYTEEPQSRIAELLLQLKEELEAYVELTASGSIASFITNVVKPLVNGEFTIQAYQEGSGDPSPVNVRNIIPFNAQKITKAGKNLFDYNSITISNVTFKDSTDQPITRSGFVYHLPRGQFKFSASGEAQAFVYMFIMKRNGDFKQRYVLTSSQRVWQAPTFTLSDGDYIIIFNAASGVVLDIANNQFMIEVGSTATAYEQYNGEVKTVDLGEDTYGAVYNSVTGGKKKIRNKVLLKDLTFFRISMGNYYIYRATISNLKTKSQYNVPCNLLCECFKSGVVYSNPQSDNEVNFTANSKNINIRCDTYTTTEEFINALGNYILTYELAEPIDETPISPTPINTFNGSNNIFCDTGDTSVTYLYKGTPPETLTRVLSKSPDVEDIIKEEKLEDLKDLDELQDLDISDKEVK